MWIKDLCDQAGNLYQLHLANLAHVSDIRKLVNSAYQELASQGLNYTASYQDDDVTRSRMSAGRTFILTAQNSVVGTITVKDFNAISTEKCSYVGQFGIAPALKGLGLGNLMTDFVEELAKQEAYSCLQLDTAKPAERLVSWYLRRGYKIAGETRFEGKTYESWIFEKRIKTHNPDDIR